MYVQPALAPYGLQPLGAFHGRSLDITLRGRSRRPCQGASAAQLHRVPAPLGPTYFLLELSPLLVGTRNCCRCGLAVESSRSYEEVEMANGIVAAKSDRGEIFGFDRTADALTQIDLGKEESV